MEERQNETNEDGKQQKFLVIEQEVKETELKKKNRSCSRGEATDTSADAAKKRVKQMKPKGGQQLTRWQHKLQQQAMKAPPKEKRKRRMVLQYCREDGSSRCVGSTCAAAALDEGRREK